MGGERGRRGRETRERRDEKKKVKKRKTHTSKICRWRSKIMSCSHIFMSKLNLHSHSIIKNRLTLSLLRIIT